MSIIMSTVVKNCLVYSDSLLFFHQALQVEKESGAEGEEEIGDSQDHLG